MLCVKATALVVILAFMAQQFLEVDGRKGQQERKGRGRGKQESLDPKPTSPGLRGSESKTSRRAAQKGSFSTKDKTQCTWVATENSAFVLAINCTRENERFNCEYTANPKLCHHYESSSRLYWKQISRSLKKQKKLCRDPKALVKAAVCKDANKQAHFSLRSPAKAQHPSELKKNDCKGLSDRKELAQEYCNSAWSSLCTFLFAMVENDGC